MPNMTSPGTGGLKLAEEIKELKQENNELKQSLDAVLHGKNIASASYDLNNYKTFGHYYVNNQTKNSPPNANSGCAVLVFGLQDERVAQLSVSGGTICTRYFSGASWSAWTSK